MAAATPTLGVCLGGQLLAAATGGTVASGPDGPEIGAYLTAKRDAAMSDPLFADLPMTPDVMQYHYDVVAALPPGAVLLLSSMGYPNQAWRQGPAAWGVQFHFETGASDLARTGRAPRDDELTGRLGPMLDEAERGDGRGVAGVRRTGSSAFAAQPPTARGTPAGRDCCRWSAIDE